MRRYPIWLLIMISFLFTQGGPVMAEDNDSRVAAIREKLRTVNYSDGISKEDAVIIAQNYILDTEVSLKDINILKPQVRQSGVYQREVLTRAYLENKFDGGGGIFDWLMKKGYFQEASGNQGHLKIMTKDENETLEKECPKISDDILLELAFSYDCWNVIFSTSASLKFRGFFWYAVDVDKHTGSVLVSRMGPLTS